MKTAKSLESAIKSGAFMVYSGDWLSIRGLNPEAVGRAIYLAISDSWDDKVLRVIGNGFLCIPNNRIADIANSEDGETVAAYTMLIKSNAAARKTYIAGNRLLAKALGEMSSTCIDESLGLRG